MRAASPTLVCSYFPLITRRGAERSYTHNGCFYQFAEEGDSNPKLSTRDNDTEWLHKLGIDSPLYPPPPSSLCVFMRIFNTIWVLSKVKPGILHKILFNPGYLLKLYGEI